jgi:hypothetical protein
MKNQLLHTFGFYKAIVKTSSGYYALWNNTLGFISCSKKDAIRYPHVSLDDFPEIQAELDRWERNREPLTTDPAFVPELEGLLSDIYNDAVEYAGRHDGGMVLGDIAEAIAVFAIRYDLRLPSENA